MDEAFLDMPSFSLHPQTLTMESIWISHWLQRLLQQQETQQSKEEKDQIYIADRSPYSAVLYAKNHGELLQPLIDEQLRELASSANVRVYTVYLRVEKELLWQRISERLKREPQRAKYNEDSKEWLDTALGFYEDPARHWDFIVENNDSTLKDLLHFVLRTLRTSVVSFEESCPVTPLSPIKVQT